MMRKPASLSDHRATLRFLASWGGTIFGLLAAGTVLAMLTK